jgi:hypothetical protein
MTGPMPRPTGTADQRRLLALVRALNDDDLITLAVFLDLSVVATAAAGEPDGPDHPAPGAPFVGPSRALVLDLAAAELARRLAAAGIVVWRPASVGSIQPAARARRGRAARFPRGGGCRR